MHILCASVPLARTPFYGSLPAYRRNAQGVKLITFTKGETIQDTVRVVGEVVEVVEEAEAESEGEGTES